MNDNASMASYRGSSKKRASDDAASMASYRGGRSSSKKKKSTKDSSSRSRDNQGDYEGENSDPLVAPGWIPLKQLNASEIDKEVNTTLAAMLPFRAPPLNPQRVLVDTSAGLKEGHASQAHVVRDFDTRFMKTSTGSPLFTTGLFVKPPTLPNDKDDTSRRERTRRANEEDWTRRGLDGTIAAAEEEADIKGDKEGHLAMELAQFTFNKFDLSRKAAGADKASEIQSLKGVDPSRIQQLLAHNIRSSAPERITEPKSALPQFRSEISHVQKKPRPIDERPEQVLPNSPPLHYISIPNVPDPIAPYSFIADRIDDKYQPLSFIDLAAGNAGEESTEASDVILYHSPPETYLHIPGREQSYFSVPATPPTLSLAAPREHRLPPVDKAARVDPGESKLKPLVPSTPPEASFFVPHREIPAMPRTHEPKTAGFGSFVATPVQEKLEVQVIPRHKGGDANTSHPPMLLPRTPAELTFDAPPGSELAKKIGNDKDARNRPDMFSIPPNPINKPGKQEKLVSKKQADDGLRPKPILPRTPAETKLTLPQRDATGAHLPPAGHFFSVPATPPDGLLEQNPAPSVVRSRRHQEDEEQKQLQDEVAMLEQALYDAEEENLKNGEGLLSPEQKRDTERHVYASIVRNRPKKRVDFGADDAPTVPLPPSPPETKAIVPLTSSFTVTNTLTNKLHQSTDRSSSTTSSSLPPALARNANIKTDVFKPPATPISAPVQPELLDLRQHNPQPEEPKPFLPATPLEHHFTLPLRDRPMGENDVNREGINFSIPPTPPAAPLALLPPPQRKQPRIGEPDSEKTILPPTPVDAKMEPLPPTKGIDMESEVSNAKKAQVFSLPATPPTMALPKSQKLIPKTLRDEEDLNEKQQQSIRRERSLESGGNESAASSSLSDLPPALVQKMKEIREEEIKKKEEKQLPNHQKAETSKDAPKPVIPHTPPELSYSLPPKFDIRRGSVQDSRSGSTASSVFTSVSQRGVTSTSVDGSRSNSINIGSSSKRPPLSSSSASSKQQQQAAPLSGEFFSLPSTPPDKSNKPLISIIRKGATQTDSSRYVMDTKPVIPSTPPDDFFVLPNKRSDGSAATPQSKIHFPPSPSALASPDGKSNNTSTSSPGGKGFVQEENRFFSIASTPPSASAPLKVDSVSKHEDYTSKLQREQDKLLRKGLTAEEATRKAMDLKQPSTLPKNLPTPPELTWDAPEIPENLRQVKPKEGFDAEKDAAHRRERTQHTEDYETKIREERDRIERVRVEAELKAAQAEERELNSAATKIQTLQRQRQARSQLKQLQENKARDEKLRENRERQRKVEEEMRRMKEEEERIARLPDDSATKIQAMQRRKTAMRELERLKQEKAREEAERQNEQKIDYMKQRVKNLEQQQRDLELRCLREQRPLTEAESQQHSQILQNQVVARQKVDELMKQESDRQKQAAQSAQNSINGIDNEIKKLKTEIAASENRIKEYDETAKKFPLLADEKLQQENLIKSRDTRQAALDKLTRERASAVEELEALEAEAAATALEQKCESIDAQIEGKKDEIVKIQLQAQTEGGRELKPEEVDKIAKLKSESDYLKRELEDARDEHGKADEEWRKQEAESDAVKQKDQVENLKSELENLAEEEQKIQDLPEKEAAALREDIDRRRAELENDIKRREELVKEKEKEYEKTQLLQRLGNLRRQEEEFVEMEIARIPISAEQKETRERNMKVMKDLDYQIRLLNFVTVKIPLHVSKPAPRGEGQTNFETETDQHQSPPRGTPRKFNNNALSTKAPLPPTPPETSSLLSLPENISAQQKKKLEITTNVPIGASFPADTPGRPLRSQIRRHGGADDAPEIIPVLPPTPPEEESITKNEIVSPSPKKTVGEMVDEDDAALKIQSLQRQRMAKRRMSRLKSQQAEAQFADAQKAQTEAEEHLKALEEEQRRLDSAARGRELTEDEAARRIQCLQRQKMARKELEKKKLAAKSQKEAAEAAKAKDEEVEAEEKLRALEEEQRQLESAAQGRELTEDEAALRIKQQLARKELEKRRENAKLQQEEAEAAKAHQETHEAETRVKELEEEQKKLESSTRGRELTEDEAKKKAEIAEQQKLAEEDLARRKERAAIEQAEADLALAEKNLKDQDEKRQDTRQPLSEDEAALRIQSIQRQRIARQRLAKRREAHFAEQSEKEQELERQRLEEERIQLAEQERERQIAEARQRLAEERRRQAALPVSGVHPHQQRPNILPPSSSDPSNNNNIINSRTSPYRSFANDDGNNNNDDEDDPHYQANRLASRAVREAAEESDRRFHMDSPTRNTNNNRSTNSGYIANTTNDHHDRSSSLPGLPNHGNNNNNDDSRESSHINGPSRYIPPQGTTSSIVMPNSNHHHQDPNNSSSSSTFGGRPTPVIIRKKGGSSQSSSASSSVNQSSLTAPSNVNKSYNFAVEESPAPRPLQPGHVMQSVADSMPETESVHQFASQLEAYFGTFDQSQLDSIKSIAPAYRHRQRDLWNFLKERYEPLAPTSNNNYNIQNQTQQHHHQQRPRVEPSLAAQSTISAVGDTNSVSPSIRIPQSAGVTLNNFSSTTIATTRPLPGTQQLQQNQHHQLPPMTPALQRALQQRHHEGTTTSNNNNTINTPTSPNPLLINRTVRASQVPNATSSRIVMPSSTAANTSTTNNNNNNITLSPSPVIIRRGSVPQQQRQNNNSNNDINVGTPNSSNNNSSVISEGIVSSDQRPSTLVEDLAMTEIVRMLQNKN